MPDVCYISEYQEYIIVTYGVSRSSLEFFIALQRSTAQKADTGLQCLKRNLDKIAIKTSIRPFYGERVCFRGL